MLGREISLISEIYLPKNGVMIKNGQITTGRNDIQPTELTPWIGWVYTFPNYRGNRYIGKLLSYAEILAEEAGMKNIYISTNHNGLYEKYGYEFYEMMKDMNGEDSRVYAKHV